MGFSTTGSAGGGSMEEDINPSPVSSPFSFSTATTNSFSDFYSAGAPLPRTDSGKLSGSVPKFKSAPPPSLPISPPTTSHFFTMPVGLSPTELLDSPVLLSSSNLLASPTTGALRAKQQLPDLSPPTNFNTSNSHAKTSSSPSMKVEEVKSSLAEFTFQSPHHHPSNQFPFENVMKVENTGEGGERQDEFLELQQEIMMIPWEFDDQKKQSFINEEPPPNTITHHHQNNYNQQQHQHISNEEEPPNSIIHHHHNYVQNQHHHEQQTNHQSQYQQQQHHLQNPHNNSQYIPINPVTTTTTTTIPMNPVTSTTTTTTTTTTTSSESTDEYNWRKYGQKQVKGSENPRSYYKCTHPGCQTKKKVERSTFDGHITEIIIKGNHSHPKPSKTRRTSSSSSSSYPLLPTTSTSPPIPPPGVIIKATPVSYYPNNFNNNNMTSDVHQENSFGSPEDTDYGTLSAIVAAGTPDNSSISVVDDEVDRGSSRSRSVGENNNNNNFTEEDDEEEEEYDNQPDAKRWKGGDGESCEIISAGTVTGNNRTEREAKVVVQTISDIDILDDGYRWRKYGQKVVKGNPNPRSYYKCTFPGCSVRKHVERAAHDIRAVLTTYEGKHLHQVPAARGSSNNRQQQPPPRLEYHHDHSNNNNSNTDISRLMAAIRPASMNFTYNNQNSSSGLLQYNNNMNMNPNSSEARQQSAALLQAMVFPQGGSVGGGFGFSSSGELNMGTSSLSSAAYYGNGNGNGNGNQSQQNNHH